MVYMYYIQQWAKTKVPVQRLLSAISNIYRCISVSVFISYLLISQFLMQFNGAEFILYPGHVVLIR